MLTNLKNDWNLLVQDESIFMHDSVMTKRRKWILKEKRPMVEVTGSHDKTIVYGVLSLDGKQLFRQYERFDSHSFIAYLEDVKMRFRKFIMFVDRATQHRSQVVKDYLQRNLETIRMVYFPVGSPEFNAVEECWRQGKCSILSNCPHSLSRLKEMVSRYYRTRRFNLDIKKYLFRSTL
jgi:transposase